MRASSSKVRIFGVAAFKAILHAFNGPTFVSEPQNRRRLLAVSNDHFADKCPQQRRTLRAVGFESMTV